MSRRTQSLTPRRDAYPPALPPRRELLARLLAYVSADMDAFGREYVFASDLRNYAACALYDAHPLTGDPSDASIIAVSVLIRDTYRDFGFRPLRARVARAVSIETAYYLPALRQALIATIDRPSSLA